MVTHSRHRDYATSLSVRGSNPGKGKPILSSPKTSGLALGPTQPPVERAIELFHGVKRPGREVNHPLPSTAEIKNERSCTSIHPIRLRGMEKETFTFTFTINLNGFYTTNVIDKVARKYGSARCQCLQMALSCSSIFRFLLRYQHYYLQ